MSIRRVISCLSTLGIVSMVSGAPAFAQSSANSSCTTSPAAVRNAADVCQKARDLFAFLVPQVGQAVAAGNPIPGDAGSLGGFGKRAISVRIVGVEAQLPRNNVPLSFTSDAVSASDFGAVRTAIPLPAVDLAFGVLPGVPLGLSNFGGVDILVGATVLPSVSKNSFSVKPKSGGIGWSYGARVGLLQESSLIPGVGVSWQRRMLPKSEFFYTPGNDTLSVTGTSVRADAIRLIVSKRLTFVGLSAGVGQDRINGKSNVSAVVNEQISGVPQRGTGSLTGLDESVKRSSAFVNASFSLLVFRVVGEFGWSKEGPERPTVNTFGSKKPNDGYRFGSLGLTAHF